MEAADIRRRRRGKGSCREHQNYNEKGVLFKLHHSRSVFRGCALISTMHNQRPYSLQVTEAGPAKIDLSVPAPLQHQRHQSLGAPNVNTSSLENMLRVVAVVQQIMTSLVVLFQKKLIY
jgi:hypothetical protein